MCRVGRRQMSCHSASSVGKLPQELAPFRTASDGWFVGCPGFKGPFPPPVSMSAKEFKETSGSASRMTLPMPAGSSHKPGDQSNGFNLMMVSLRSGPVDMIEIGAPTNSSSRRKYT